jgi:multimeric flavodoxin WrbA
MIKQPEPRVVLVSGSPRRNGNSDALLKAAREGIKSQGVPAETVFLRDYVYQPCTGCEECRKAKTCTQFNDGMTLLYPKIEAARGLVLACPTHNYNVTSWMKSFIDRLYCYYDFTDSRPRKWSSRLAGQGRKAVLMGICEQEGKSDMGFVIEAMQFPFTALGYEVIHMHRVYKVFDRGLVRKQPDVLEQARRFGASLAESIK